MKERGWSFMETAPRDGTLIEIKNSYGIAPKYCLARWTKEYTNRQTGLIDTLTDHSWIIPGTNGGPCYDFEFAFLWRPYDGDPDRYVDPTNGLQDQPEYEINWMLRSRNIIL